MPYIPNKMDLWEPACGDQAMQRVLATKHRTVGTDIAIDDKDFLQFTAPPDPDIIGIVTNPPFNKLAEQFIRHAIGMNQIRFAAFLLPVDFDSAKTRRDIFADCPSFHMKIVLTSRIVWFKHADIKAGPSSNHAWFVWNKDKHPDTLPTIAYHFMPKRDTQS